MAETEVTPVEVPAEEPAAEAPVEAPVEDGAPNLGTKRKLEDVEPDADEENHIAKKASFNGPEGAVNGVEVRPPRDQAHPVHRSRPQGGDSDVFASFGAA